MYRFPRKAAGTEQRVVLALRSGEWTVEDAPAIADAVAGAWGFADVVRQGVFGRRSEVLVAIWTEAGVVHLYVGGREWTFPGDCSVTRRTRAPFLKRFEVRCGSSAAVQLDYWHADTEWPPSEDSDLLLKIAITLASDAQRERFVYWWSHVAEGAVPWSPEFQALMVEYDRRGGDIISS